MPPRRTYSKVIHSRVRKRDSCQGFEEGRDVPFACDGHDGFANGVVRGVEADGKFGADGFRGELLNAREDSGGADSHARLRNRHLSEDSNSVHEVGVVQKGLAHAHEDEVDARGAVITAGTAEFDLMAVEDRGDLAGYLASSEVAADAEFGGEAELAVHSTTDLARDADGRATVRKGGWIRHARFGIFGFLLFRGLGAVAPFAAIAVGHPDGFDGLAVGHADQIAFCSVDGAGGLDDLGQAYGVALGCKVVAKGLGEGGGLVQRCNALAIEGRMELRRAVRLLAETS